MSSHVSGSSSSSSRPGGAPSKRRPSFPSSDASEVLSGIDSAKPPPPASALLKHGKYVAFGLGGCWYSGIVDAIVRVLDSEGGWIRKTLVAALASHALTIVIFLYLVVFLPRIRGYIPNYPAWQDSARLRVLVPVLTATILLGWTFYVVSLTQGGKAPLDALDDAVHAIGDVKPSLVHGESLGLLKAMAGATSLYTISLGVLGFIPAPAGVPVRTKKDK